MINDSLRQSPSPTLTVSVQLFAGAAAAMGARSVTVDVTDQATIAELRLALEQRYPNLRPWLTHSRWAVGTDFVNEQHSLKSSQRDAIAMIPPVSGG